MSDKSSTTWGELESFLYEVPVGSIYTFKQMGSGKWIASIIDPSKMHVQGEGETIAEALNMAVTAMLTLLHEEGS